MMLSGSAISAVPVSAAEDESTPEQFLARIATTDTSGWCYLVEVEARQGSSGVTYDTAAPICWGPLSALPDELAGLDETVTLRWSDAGWVGEPDDPDQPNQPYEGRALVPLAYERAAPVSPDGDVRLTNSFGVIEIANQDGAYDTEVERLSVSQRPVTVRFGPRDAAPGIRAPYAGFGRVLKARATAWTALEQVLRIELGDAAHDLESAAAQPTTYAGTGGAEGSADMAGMTKPLCLGEGYNVTPTQVAADIWQVHSRAVEAITAVRVRGAAVTASGSDYPDFAALQAASVSAGQFATCLAEAMLKLGTTPNGQVTADVQGDAVGGYVDSTGEIVARYLRAFQGWSTSAINLAAWYSLPAGSIGIYLPGGDQSSAASLIDRIVSGLGGYWGSGRDGRLSAGRLIDPSDYSPSLSLDASTIIEVIPLGVPVPVWRQEGAYRPNWTPQTDIADSVAADDRRYYESAGLTVAAADTAIRARDAGAREAAPAGTLFVAANDAQDVVNRTLSLHGVNRARYAIRTGAIGHLVQIGDVMRVTWPRYGLASGKKLLVTGVREEADRRQTILTVWG